jgi:hypothetical protein
MTRAILAAILALSLVAGSAAMLQPAFAHAHATLTLEDEPVTGKQISVVLGHENEPTFGAKAGIHDGKHGMDIFLSDAATELPLTGASLKADKYYFKDIRSFERATSPEDADAVVKAWTCAQSLATRATTLQGRCKSRAYTATGCMAPSTTLAWLRCL